ncbi:hypothetical protein TELCIR_21653 [Teladorsagia circumcincta]|uniref:Uncharacterized protein n=1 Tax=Teladorsagia circumcincta TaxID=45464 RepID=A0A2G9TG55_TELCI|nr:hypothetical protein TELCIR_21653 [Teladorsagia circumcincta]
MKPQACTRLALQFIVKAKLHTNAPTTITGKGCMAGPESGCPGNMTVAAPVVEYPSSESSRAYEKPDLHLLTVCHFNPRANAVWNASDGNATS